MTTDELSGTRAESKDKWTPDVTEMLSAFCVEQGLSSIERPRSVSIVEAGAVPVDQRTAGRYSNN